MILAHSYTGTLGYVHTMTRANGRGKLKKGSDRLAFVSTVELQIPTRSQQQFPTRSQQHIQPPTAHREEAHSHSPLVDDLEDSLEANAHVSQPEKRRRSNSIIEDPEEERNDQHTFNDSASFQPKRRLFGSGLYTTLKIRETLNDSIEEFPPNLAPQPTQQPLNYPACPPPAADTLHIPPEILAIAKDNPDVLVAYINAVSKSLDVKKAQIEAGTATAPTAFSKWVQNKPARLSSVVDQSTGNPWVASEAAEVR